MNREDKLREELEDAWFALVMEKIAQQEGAELNALNEQLKKNPKYAVPEEITRQNLDTIRKLAVQEKRRKAGRSAGRIFIKVACVAAVMGALMVSVYAALPPSRKTAVLNLLVEVTDVSTRLVMEEVHKVEVKQPESSESEPKVLLGYQIPDLPEEFKLQDEISKNSFSWALYENNIGQTVLFRFVHDPNGAIEVDTENANTIPVTIQDQKGLLIDKNGTTQLVWNDSETNTFILIESVGLEAEYIQELAAGIRFLDK